MWNYYWGYSAAQIELAIADGPVIVYKKDKKSGAKSKPTAASIERSMLRYEERKRAGKTQQVFDPSEFFVTRAVKK